jgi:hypothetical protein
MEHITLAILIIFLVVQIFDFLIKVFIAKPPSSSYENKPLEYYMDIVNSFIRKEAAIEILKWLMEGKIEKSTNTMDTTFVSQLTNSEEIKKRTSIITNIIATKVSPDIHVVFNRVYRKNINPIDNKSSIDISLREYIARYIFFMFRRLTYDITIMINSAEFSSKKIETVINAYIVSLEETIYSNDKIYLVKNKTIIDNTLSS